MSETAVVWIETPHLRVSLPSGVEFGNWQTAYEVPVRFYWPLTRGDFGTVAE